MVIKCLWLHEDSQTVKEIVGLAAGLGLNLSS